MGATATKEAVGWPKHEANEKLSDVDNGAGAVRRKTELWKPFRGKGFERSLAKRCGWLRPRIKLNGGVGVRPMKTFFCSSTFFPYSYAYSMKLYGLL